MSDGSSHKSQYTMFFDKAKINLSETEYCKIREFHMSPYLDFFQEENLILDVGSHDCTLSLAAKKKGKKVISLDISPGDSRVLKGDIKKLPFKKNSFDGVFLSHVIEHLPIADVSKGLSEIHRVLKPKGKLVIATPHPSIFNNIFWEDPSHIRPYPIKAINVLFGNNFEIVRVVKRVRSHNNLLMRLRAWGLFWVYKKVLSRLWHLPKAYRENIIVSKKTL